MTPWPLARLRADFDGEGWFLAAWGKWGYEDSQFDGPVSVAIDGKGDIYVTDDSGGL